MRVKELLVGVRGWGDALGSKLEGRARESERLRLWKGMVVGNFRVKDKTMNWVARVRWRLGSH